MDMLAWLSEWYKSNCDGDWEHCYGINISTLDNPGWKVTIDITDTELEEKEFKMIKVERTEDDWIYCRFSDNVFLAAGGIYNLEEIFITFKKWIENE